MADESSKRAQALAIVEGNVRIDSSEQISALAEVVASSAMGKRMLNSKADAFVALLCGIECGVPPAKMVAIIATAPKGYERLEDVLVAVQAATRLDIPVDQACHAFAVVNGRPGLWGDWLIAQCKRSPVWHEPSFRESLSGEGDERFAHSEMGRVCHGGELSVRSNTYSVRDAKRAGLWGKSGPWTTNPDRMLLYRARTFTARDLFPDALKGATGAEELRDIPDVEVVSTSAPQLEASRSESLADRIESRTTQPEEHAAEPEPAEETTSSSAEQLFADTDRAKKRRTQFTE